jgi:2-oxoisovalerate dehydrogenase E1 component
MTGAGVTGAVVAGPVRAGSNLTADCCLAILDAQLASRHLDEAARWLRSRDTGYYTIGSSGHESNAAVAAALRLTDPALLHYRSGASPDAGCCGVPTTRDRADVHWGGGRGRQAIAGGRHKVWART